MIIKRGKFKNTIGKRGEIVLNPKELHINVDKMKDYYETFDTVEFKYLNLLKMKGKGLGKREERYIRFSNYEDSQQFEELTKCEFHNLQANLDMAYADKELTDKLFEVYNLLGDKIVRRYINIDGIERLFSEKYANFEWEMHLGMDHKKHSMKFYRDHFIHQIKDAYTMAMLLEKSGFYSKVKRILMDTGSSKVSRYVNNMLEQQTYLPRKKVFYSINKDELKEHYIYNIIYMASYMAGLFHDIGYPTVSNMQEHRQMIDYMAENHFFEKGGYDFNSIAALLQNTLLFRLVSPSEIRGRIEGDEIDHGTVSALLFLLHFYENGAIYRLEPYKLCAVELAGLAIYNHTNKYTYIGQKDAQYERCVFALNPISYLLRICDDMQEWGRIYFEVSEQSNLIICEECHMPIKRKKDNNTVIYQCGCENKILFAPVFKYYQFPYRRIFNVSVCDNMKVLLKEGSDDYEFHLNYDLGKLLHIAYINPGYARYRVKELAQMKHLFPRQYSIGMVFVDYFVTSNIILIKSKILGEYLKKSYSYYQKYIEIKMKNWIDQEVAILEQQKGENKQDIKNNNVRKGVQYVSIKELVDEIYKHISVNYKNLKNPKNAQKQYLKDAFNFYIFIYIMMCLGKIANTEYPLHCEIIQKKISVIFKKWHKSKKNKDFYTEDLKLLINDCEEQIKNIYGNLSNYRNYPENYFKTFQPEKDKEEIYYDALIRFIDVEKYEINGEEVQHELDAFTDLYWFRKMLGEIDS